MAMKQWYLNKADDGSGHISITVELEHIWAAGDCLAPYLALELIFNKPIAGGNTHIPLSRILAISLDLYSNINNGTVPWMKTGYMPLKSNELALIPLSHALIEEISRSADTNQAQTVYFQVAISVMAKLDDDASEVQDYFQNGHESISINAIDWQKFLEGWGYPVHRFVPISSQLPNPISTENKLAAERWKDAYDNAAPGSSGMA